MASKNGKKSAGNSSPPKDTGRAGRGAYQVNLSDEERDVVDRGAALSGLERSTFMRSESVKAARRLVAEAEGTT